MAPDMERRDERALWRRLLGPRVFCPGTLAAVVALGFGLVALLFALSLPPNPEPDTAADDPVAVHQTLPNHDVRMDGAPSTAPSEPPTTQ